jgi:hypothetical protein
MNQTVFVVDDADVDAILKKAGEAYVPVDTRKVSSGTELWPARDNFPGDTATLRRSVEEVTPAYDEFER